ASARMGAGGAFLRRRPRPDALPPRAMILPAVAAAALPCRLPPLYRNKRRWDGMTVDTEAHDGARANRTTAPSRRDSARRDDQLAQAMAAHCLHSWTHRADYFPSRVCPGRPLTRVGRQWARMLLRFPMPAAIVPLVDLAAHLPNRGALIGLDLGTKTIGVASS